MAWMSYADGRGRGWAINPEGCAHLIRSNHYERQLVQRSRIVRSSRGLLLPTLTQVETNFTGLRDAATNDAAIYTRNILRECTSDPQRFYGYLVHVREDGQSAATHYREMLANATRETARAIDSNVNGWENALSAARFVRDASAGILMVGATILSGGAALGVGAAGTGLTFTGNTQDNLAANQTMRQAMGNAAVSTSIAVTTNILIPRGLNTVGRSMVGTTQQLSTSQNLAIGLISVQANMAGGLINTAVTADGNLGPEARAQAQREMEREVGARAATEMASMLFGTWLQSRGLPMAATLEMRQALGEMRESISGGLLSAIGDRVVNQIRQRGSGSGDLDMAFTQLRGVFDAESYVREVAMRPL